MPTILALPSAGLQRPRIFPAANTDFADKFPPTSKPSAQSAPSAVKIPSPGFPASALSAPSAFQLSGPSPNSESDIKR